MSVLESTEDFSIFSVGGTGVGDLVAEQASGPANQPHSQADKAKQTSVCARITEMLNGQQTTLDGEYHFEQLPAPNDQIVILNRRRSHDIMRVLHSAREPEAIVYVRWVARR
jgi:hypothetical protein